MPRVRSDGKDLDFKPGKNGSLTYQGSVDPAPGAPYEPKVRAKTVPSPAVEEEQNNKKVAMNIANTMMSGKLGYK